MQVSAVRGLAEIGSADAGGILLPRLRGFEPSVRAAAVQTMLTRADWTKALLEAVSGDGRAGGLGPGLIEAADRAPLLRAQGCPDRAARTEAVRESSGEFRAQVISDYSTAIRAERRSRRWCQGLRAGMQDLPQDRRAGVCARA